jgi:hypothetical protein
MRHSSSAQDKLQPATLDLRACDSLHIHVHWTRLLLCHLSALLSACPASFSLSSPRPITYTSLSLVYISYHVNHFTPHPSISLPSNIRSLTRNFHHGVLSTRHSQSPLFSRAEHLFSNITLLVLGTRTLVSTLYKVHKDTWLDTQQRTFCFNVRTARSLAPWKLSLANRQSLAQRTHQVLVMIVVMRCVGWMRACSRQQMRREAGKRQSRHSSRWRNDRQHMCDSTPSSYAPI